MFSRKFVLTSCLAIATSMLAGCASYKNESGLPKWLDDASEANRLGYFMGISLKDSPAPEGFDPSKNTLVSDVTFSAAAHGLNAATGAMDIGSFGVELGLSLATNILKREEEEYSQANVYCTKRGLEFKAQVPFRLRLLRFVASIDFHDLAEFVSSFIDRSTLQAFNRSFDGVEACAVVVHRRTLAG